MRMDMNRNQAIAIAVAAANVVVIMLFPPFDTYGIAKSQLPVFAGFYFYPHRTLYMIVNTGVLFLELFIVLINAGIAWLLLRTKEVQITRRRASLQNTTLLVVAVNLVVILLWWYVFHGVAVCVFSHVVVSPAPSSSRL